VNANSTESPNQFFYFYYLQPPSSEFVMRLQYMSTNLRQNKKIFGHFGNMAFKPHPFILSRSSSFIVRQWKNTNHRYWQDCSFLPSLLLLWLICLALVQLLYNWGR
jgi:hypothetical protein